ncbi:ankyrin repeat-containing protein [Colletotrichum camelliae]|nr:ankyrin repeat-containing protein [Colletotrichum camelliae]
MRLLHTSTLKLKEFIGSPPRYAILSHTWGDEEVLYADLQADLTEKTGWKKVVEACRVARDLKYEWIWIDTCCIDKSSSAELSEAINSMFRWYQKSSICIAYLADVLLDDSTGPGQTVAVTQSRWFRRGWTLQELLAPVDLCFYSGSWEIIGARHDLKYLIAEITRIDTKYLRSREHTPYPSRAGDVSDNPIFQASVAERMRWASRRETTRIEDAAYCLLGIFNVNMSLIYGEGPNAYRRLQEAILQKFDDHSIFAWGRFVTPSELPSQPGSVTSFLAPHPIAFDRYGTIVPFQTPNIRARIRVAHDAVTIDVPLWEPLEQCNISGKRMWLAPLLCHYQGSSLHCIALVLTCDAIYESLQRTSPPPVYYRMGDVLVSVPKRIWLPKRLHPVVLPFKSIAESNSHLPRNQGIIRTLPHSYEPMRLLHCRGGLFFQEGWSGPTVSMDLGLAITRSPASLEYHLGTPAFIWMSGKQDRNLILMVQLLSFNTGKSKRSNSLRFPDSKYLLYHLAYDHPSTRGIEARMKNGFQQLGRLLETQTPVYPHGAGINMSAHLSSTGPHSQWYDLLPTCNLRVTVSRDPEYDPNTSLLDIEDPHGRNVSREDEFEQYFAPLGQATSGSG